MLIWILGISRFVGEATLRVSSGQPMAYPKNSPATRVSQGLPVSHTRSMRVRALWTWVMPSRSTLLTLDRIWDRWLTSLVSQAAVNIGNSKQASALLPLLTYDDLGVNLLFLESLRSAGSDSGVMVYFQDMHDVWCINSCLESSLLPKHALLRNYTQRASGLTGRSLLSIAREEMHCCFLTR